MSPTDLSLHDDCKAHGGRCRTGCRHCVSETAHCLVKGGGVFDSPTGIEQIIPLVGDMDPDTEIIVGCQEVDDPVSQMMNVDGYP